MPNTRFKNAIERRPQKTPPVWFMRQAGRYHQHYQNLRKKNSFMELCKTPELAAEVAMGPITDFDFDVAIFFSDLLFPLEALGFGLTYTDSGPQLSRKLNATQMSQLPSVGEAIAHLEFQKNVMVQTRKRLPSEKSLIGFVGGPWTLFSYAVEGSHRGPLNLAKSNFKLFGKFCEVLVPLLQANIELQLEGGAEMVMIFDTAAGDLPPLVFSELIADSIQALATSFRGRLGYYTKHAQLAYFSSPRIRNLPLAGIGLDHHWDLPYLFRSSQTSWPFKGFVQGNFDPALMLLSKDQFLTELNRYLDSMAHLSEIKRAGWVCGLGHGVYPHTPEENVRLFVSTVRERFHE